ERPPGLFPEQFGAVSFVELPPPADADVGLVAFHLAAGERLAAELNAAVPRVGDELHFQRQFEVPQQKMIDEKLIPREAFARADDLTILDAPQFGLPFP